MNVDRILETFNGRHVDYLLIGGMNFLLRHQPVLTFDVDLWIRDAAENRRRCEVALGALDAAWGASEREWAPVRGRAPGWLGMQGVYCLTSPYGSIDVFRSVPGLDDWGVAWDRAYSGHTASGVAYRGIADEDMLACQLALPDAVRKTARILALEQAIRKHA